MKNIRAFLLLLFLLILNRSQAARILGFFSFPSVSHQAFFYPITRELSLRGHEVTVITTNPLKNSSLKNLTEIDVSESYAIFNKYDITFYSREHQYPWTSAYLFQKINEELAEMQFINEKVKNIFKKSEHYFDLILIEGLYPGLYALTAKFKAPLISLISHSPQNFHLQSMGCPTHPILSPELLSELGPKFNFWERMDSAFVSLTQFLTFKFLILPEANSFIKKHFGNNVQDVEEYVKNTSLFFVNVNPIFSPRRPYTPRVIEISQLISPNKQLLSQDLKNILDDSKNGAIYISLGTNVRNMPTHFEQILFKTLEELPFTILLKWHTEKVDNKPKNVIVRKWFQQDNILKHKNIKVFITQGGSQSTEEAVVNGVPMVVIPFFGDQYYNAKMLNTREVAVMVEIKTLTKDILLKAIKKVANDPKYKFNAKHYQKLMVDQPLSGLETVIWWCEHVIRNKGADHLKSPSGDVPLYQYYFLDVFGFIFLVLFILYKITFIIINYIKNIFIKKQKVN